MDDKLRDAPEGFIAWFRANYRDVVDFGSDPAWHAKAIYKNAMHHARAALAAPVSAQPEAVQAAARRLLDKDAPDIYAGDVRMVAEAVLGHDAPEAPEPDHATMYRFLCDTAPESIKAICYRFQEACTDEANASLDSVVAAAMRAANHTKGRTP